MVQRRRARGFTLIELLIVVVLISLISIVAYPALSTFTGRNADASAATRVSRMFNKTMDQARRRNRAYIVQFSAINADRPLGMMSIRQSDRPSCMLSGLAESTLIEQVPLGGTVRPDLIAAREENVGLAGWSRNGADPVVNVLTLCISPNGAVSLGIGATAEALGGQLDVLVQRFDGAGNDWEVMGPPRRVEITYAGGARLGLN